MARKSLTPLEKNVKEQKVEKTSKKHVEWTLNAERDKTWQTQKPK